MALNAPEKSPSVGDADDLPPPPPAAAAAVAAAPAPPRRRERDARDRRDDRDSDRPPARRDYAGDRGSPPPPPRDRDRDYKRRNRSPSSPPPRDRRYSSPPPQFKRSRRGSPRGSDDRAGYGYNGGYDRGMGGRPYGDEKPHGRFMNRGGYQHGPADGGFNRGGYADSSNRGYTQRDGLMSYKQFIQELEDDILPAEAERRYQEYRTEYISTQKRAFFNSHKEEEWLKNKYHPTNLVAVIEQRNEHARQVAKDFLLDLESGTLDLNPTVTASSSSKLGQTSEPNSEDDPDNAGNRKRHGRVIDDTDFSAAPKAHPASCEPARVEADIKQAISLIQKLDAEKGIEENCLRNVDYSKSEGDKQRSGMGPIVVVRSLTSFKGLEGTELLDTVITYLWRVHGVDYYGMIESNEAKGLRHVRPENGKNNHMETTESRVEWEKKLDSFWKERLEGQDPMELMTGKEKIESAAIEALDPHVRKIRDEKYGWKYGCGAKGCTKLFHASEFVHKHLKLKHPELVVELTVKVREDLYFQNYMNDSDAPGGKPVMQQPLKEIPPQRRRVPMESRLRDDRVQRRDHDRVDGVNEGEQNDNVEMRDGQSKDGDESMYDSYGGQDMTDMPPILMPVPGAGPLGPFVPAPPEVAMQMFRDQGGSSMFDGNSKLRSGPHVGGPAPIISSGFRQDPRRMRSYQDLDAPEDEVTVIDYRSL